MKKFCYVIAAMGIALGACASNTPATDNPLGKLLGGASQSGSESSIGGAIGGLIGGLLSTDKVTPEQMVGTWNYESPAVCFKSENFLQKAGGSAVAGTIESKLAPYYKTLGLNKLTLTVKEDNSFAMTSGAIKMSGTIEAKGDGDVYFKFAALGKISLGQMKAYVVKSAGNKMSLMFDVSKLVNIIKGVGSVTGSSSIKTITTLLDSYDGICAGFKLQKK